MTEPLWTPSAERIAATRLTAFTKRLADERQVRVDGYDALWRWSVDEPSAFWDLAWDFLGVIGDKGDVVLENADKMPGGRFFPKGKINFAEIQHL